jgi:hypothetical protein
MKNIIPIVVASILISCNSATREAQKHFENAQENYQLRELGKADKEIELALKLNSSKIEFKVLSATIKSESNRYDMAIEILNELLDSGYVESEVTYKLALAYFASSSVEDDSDFRLKKSIDFANNTIDLDIDYLPAYKLKLKSLHNLKLYSESIEVIGDALQLYPDNMQLIAFRGVEKYQLGDYSGAKRDFNKALMSSDLDSLDISTFYRFKALMSQEEKKTDSSMYYVEKSILYNPQNGYAYGIRASFLKNNGLIEEACEDYRKAADLGHIEFYKEIKELCH